MYDPVKRIWIWRYNDGDQQLDFEVETGEFIRFRVVALQYNRIESMIQLLVFYLENNTVVTSEVKSVEHDVEKVHACDDLSSCRLVLELQVLMSKGRR